MKKTTLKKIDLAWRIFGGVLLALFFFFMFREDKIGTDYKITMTFFLLITLYIIITAIVLFINWIKRRKKRKV